PPAPLLTAISVSWTNPTKALLIWTTDQAANSTVEWGIDTGYGSATNSAALVKIGRASSSKMTPSTLYHYRVSSTNATGQSAVSADNSSIAPALPPPPAPLLTAISASWASSTNAMIVWTTDQAANSTVEWGIDTGYGSATNSAALV